MLNRCLLIAVVLSLFSFDSTAQKKKGVSSASEIIKVGITAPDFEISKLETILKNPEPEKAAKVKLSEEYTSKPVLLLFGSYTWPPFRSSAPALEALYREYKDKVKFYIVYVKEAHPACGWQVKSNKLSKVIYDTPKTMKERAKIASDCVKDLKLTIPCLIDDMKDTVQKTYMGWPARACLIGKDGKIIFASKAGPRGVTAKEIEKALKEKIKK